MSDPGSQISRSGVPDPRSEVPDPRFDLFGTYLGAIPDPRILMVPPQMAQNGLKWGQIWGDLEVPDPGFGVSDPEMSHLACQMSCQIHQIRRSGPPKSPILDQFWTTFGSKMGLFWTGQTPEIRLIQAKGVPEGVRSGLIEVGTYVPSLYIPSRARVGRLRLDFLIHTFAMCRFGT